MGSQKMVNCTHRLMSLKLLRKYGQDIKKIPQKNMFSNGIPSVGGNKIKIPKILPNLFSLEKVDIIGYVWKLQAGNRD